MVTHARAEQTSTVKRRESSSEIAAEEWYPYRVWVMSCESGVPQTRLQLHNVATPDRVSFPVLAPRSLLIHPNRLSFKVRGKEIAPSLPLEKKKRKKVSLPAAARNGKKMPRTCQSDKIYLS